MSRRNMTTFAVGIGIATIGFGGGMAARQLFAPPAASVPSAASLSLLDIATVPADALAAGPERRPDFSFLDQDSRPRTLSDWDGQVVVVNFWATWCPPCVEEIPAFIDAQRDYAQRQVQFVGIALDDIDSVRDFIADMALNYPTASGDQSAMELMQQFGNPTGGLPFTAVVDGQGRIVHRHVGPMTRPQLDDALVPVLEAQHRERV